MEKHQIVIFNIGIARAYENVMLKIVSYSHMRIHIEIDINKLYIIYAYACVYLIGSNKVIAVLFYLNSRHLILVS